MVLHVITVGTEMALTPYREAFSQMPLGAVVIDKALSPPVVAECRAGLETQPFVSFYLADRGRYELLDEVDAPALLGGLRELAGFVADERLAILDARCLRLRRGDYSLRRDDARTRPAGEHLYELVADLSAQSSGEAQVVYTRGPRTLFVAPQLSGSVSLVARPEGVERYDRYLSCQAEGLTVYRLRLWLGRVEVDDTDPPPRLFGPG